MNDHFTSNIAVYQNQHCKLLCTKNIGNTQHLNSICLSNIFPNLMFSCSFFSYLFDNRNQMGQLKPQSERQPAKQGGKQAALEKLPQSVKGWFVQLSFWKKIIIIFTLNTLILLVLTDAIMLILFGKISEDIIGISNTEKDQFNQVSNTQIAGATAKMALSKFDLYAGFLSQLANAYYYFNANPQLYTTLETASPPSPALTSSFPNASYSQPGMYYLDSQAAFTALPYLDELMAKMIRSENDVRNIRRITVYVQGKGNASDLTARTVPASSDFTIPSAAEITKRFASVSAGSYSLSPPYLDSLTTSPNKTGLFALRTVLNTTSTSNIFLEIELVQNAVISSMQNIYYFSSTIIMLAQKIGSSYAYFTTGIDPIFLDQIASYYPIGTSRITVRGQDYVTASVGLPNTFTLGKYSVVTNTTNDPIRCIILVAASETEAPAIEIQSFLSNQSSILNGIVFCWSFIILLSTVALATVVGNYIFSNLKMLSTKMEEYIKDPSKFHLIVIELKQLQLKGILKKLSDNLIGIIEKIEVRKRERKDRINQNYHPLSVGEPKFQERQQLNDYEIIEEIKEQVRMKVEVLKRQAEEKEQSNPVGKKIE